MWRPAAWDKLKGDFFSMLAAEGRAVKTLANYREAIDQFLGFFLATNPRRQPKDVTVRDIEAFILHLRRRKLADNTVANRFRSLRRFFGWACRRRYLRLNPIEGAGRPRERIEAVKPFTAEEVDRLLRATRAWPALALRDQTIIAILYNTGLRVGELTKLRPADIRNHSMCVKGKGRKERWVALEATTEQLLMAYSVGRQGRTIFGLSVSGLQHRLTALGIRANVPDVHPHRFRDTFAECFLGNGGRVDDLQTILGHAKIETTMRYVQYHREQRAMEAQRKYAPFAVAEEPPKE